jgi:hypothetical protein
MSANLKNLLIPASISKSFFKAYAFFRSNPKKNSPQPAKDFQGFFYISAKIARLWTTNL